jgi:SHS2 domain-containing protein
VRIGAAHHASLLAGWMGELVELAQRDGFIPERVVRLELERESLDATVGGERSVPQDLIKAVTYDRVEIEQDEGLWRARVVLDL